MIPPLVVHSRKIVIFEKQKVGRFLLYTKTKGSQGERGPKTVKIEK